MQNERNNEFIIKAIKVHGDLYIYDDIIYKGSRVKIAIRCHKHGIFEQRPSRHLCGDGCPKCANERRANIRRHSIDTFISDARSIHGDIYRYDNSIYVRNNVKLDIICNIHGVFPMAPTDHIYGKQGCPKCGIIKRSISRSNGKERFIELANIKHNDYYGYDEIDEYKNNKTPVPIRCPKHGIFIQRPDSHLHGKGCILCSPDKVGLILKKDKDEFINMSKLLFGETLRYDKLEYDNNCSRITLDCIEHGEFTTTPDDHLNRLSTCPKCGKSKGERLVSMFLKNNNIKFIREYRLETNLRYAYDFYLPDLNTLIEYDGIFHYRAFKHFGGEKYLSTIKENDKKKDELAKELGINMIRIHYRYYNVISEYLGNILVEKFPDKFNISIHEQNKILLNSVYRVKLI